MKAKMKHMTDYQENVEKLSAKGTEFHIFEVSMNKEEKYKLSRKLTSMISRCNNPKDKSYKWYGAKGIKVFEKWINDRNEFYKWAERNNYKIGMSIERYNNDKDYCPSNCCVIPFNEQPRNTSRNVFVDYNGETIIISDVAKKEGVCVESIRKRIKRGKYRVVDNPNRLRENPNTLS